MIMIWDLPHLVIEHPFRKFAGELLLGHKVEGFFHVGHFLWSHFYPMFTQDCDRDITRITVENCKAYRVVEFSIPLSVMGKLTEITTPLGHRRPSFGPD